ncbi:aldolase/citrate lyase family protein, partial [Dehalococcoidia bacterium]|nr:aldolase/citrate lyase family protein [Dehalococcoidia bacterium]
MLAKASQLPADVLVPDLEDSVPESEKRQARKVLQATITSLAQHGQTIIPRVNALDTGLAEDDMAAIVCPQVYAVTVGKIKSPWDILQLSAILDGLEFKAQLPNGSI